MKVEEPAIEAALTKLARAFEELAESRQRLGVEVERSLSVALAQINQLDQIVRGQVDASET